MKKINLIIITFILVFILYTISSASNQVKTSINSLFQTYKQSSNYFEIQIPKDIYSTLKIKTKADNKSYNWGNPQSGPFINISYFYGSENLSLQDWFYNFEKLIKPKMKISYKRFTKTKNGIPAYEVKLEPNGSNFKIRALMVKSGNLYYMFQYIYSISNPPIEIAKSIYFINNIKVFK